MANVLASGFGCNIKTAENQIGKQSPPQLAGIVDGGIYPMPIRVECDECGAELRLGDDAAGRRVKCRECGAGVSVPNERPRRKKKPARRKKAAKRKPDEEEEVSFEDLDFGSLAKLEKRETGLGQGAIIECPECGETVAENIDECPYCGEVVSERVKSERRAKKRLEILGEQPNMTVHYIVITIFVLAVGGVVAYIMNNME